MSSGALNLIWINLSSSLRKIMAHDFCMQFSFSTFTRGRHYLISSSSVEAAELENSLFLLLAFATDARWVLPRRWRLFIHTVKIAGRLPAQRTASVHRPWRQRHLNQQRQWYTLPLTKVVHIREITYNKCCNNIKLICYKNYQSLHKLGTSLAFVVDNHITSHGGVNW